LGQEGVEVTSAAATQLTGVAVVALVSNAVLVATPVVLIVQKLTTCFDARRSQV
jgi:hypothetical protein